MGSSNWVAIVSVIATSLATGYVTYLNNKSNTELEKTKQEYLLSVEKLKQDNLIALENLKSTKEKEKLRQSMEIETRTQYCNEAKSIYKELGNAIIGSQDRNIEMQAAASNLASKLKIQAFAYLDDAVYDNYIKQSKSAGDSNHSAIAAALATQIRRCSAIKPSDA